MKFRPLLRLCLLLTPVLGTQFCLSAEVPRIAIIAEPAAGAFADVLNAELSKGSTLQVVERAELNRIAAEQQVQNLAPAERPLALAQLTKADGLLFAAVEAGEKDHPLLVLRLSGTARGRMMQSLVLPWLPNELETNAKLAASRFKGAFQKLRASGNGTALAVSMLGLRGSVDTPALRDAETRLNILLAHQLGQQPGVNVLERWRMDDLVFERGLSHTDPPTFESAALLADGSITKRPDGFQIQLRLRHSETDPGTVHEIDAPSLDSDNVVAQIINKITGTPPLEMPRDGNEAASFAELGRYLMKHDLAPQAAQALESAVALGDVSIETLVTRVEAYAFCGFARHLGRFEPFTGAHTSFALTHEDARYRLAAVTRATRCAAELSERDPVPLTDHERRLIFAWGAGTFRAAGWVLRGLQQSSLQIEHKAEASELRTELRRLVQLLDKSELNTKVYHLLCEANLAPCWCASPEDTLAYYRLVLFSPEYAQRAEPGKPSPWPLHLRRDMEISLPQNGLFLDQRPITSPYGIPRLMDWESTDPSRIKKLWAGFIEELLAAPDLDKQSLGHAFALAAHNDPQIHSKLLAETAEFLSANVERLAKEGDQAMFEPLNMQFWSALRSPKGDPIRDRMIEFLKSFLARSPWVSWTCLLWAQDLVGLGKDSNLSPQILSQLLSALDGSVERARRAGTLTDILENEVRRTRQALINASTEPIAPANEDGLLVKRVWNPYRHSPVPCSGGRLADRTVSVNGDKVWFYHSGLGVVAMDPATLQCTVTPFRPDSYPMVTQVIPMGDDLWAATLTGIWRGKRNSSGWSRLDLPERRYGLGFAGSSLLVGSLEMPMNVQVTTSGMVIGEIAPSHDLRWLVSSRRRPPEHPLDSVDTEYVIGLFAGPEKTPWAALLTKDGYRRAVFSLAAPDKPKLTFPKVTPVVKACGARTLLYERQFSVVQAWLVDPDQKAPVLLLNDPAQSGVADTVVPRWPMPKTLGERNLAAHCPTLYGDELWILRWGSSQESIPTELELVGLLPGQAKPVKIPLRLAPSQEDLAKYVPRFPSAIAPESPAHTNVPREGLVATSYGLVFAGDPSPFIWIIPWSDIHAWVAAHP